MLSAKPGEYFSFKWSTSKLFQKFAYIKVFRYAVHKTPFLKISSNSGSNIKPKRHEIFKKSTGKLNKIIFLTNLIGSTIQCFHFSRRTFHVQVVAALIIIIIIIIIKIYVHSNTLQSWSSV